jgi:hypothetical protein
MSSWSRRIACLAPVLLAGIAHADEVRLRDGTTLVGQTRSAGDAVIVETLEGTVRVARQDIVRIRTDAELHAELETLATRSAATPFARLQLAETARDWGLQDAMWELLDECIDACRQAPHLQARLRAFLGALEPQVLPAKWRRAPTDVRVRELLLRVRGEHGPALAAAVAEILAREPDADESLRQRARSAGQPAERLTAVEALALRPGEGNDRFALRTPIVDGSAEVRREAARAIARRGAASDAIRYLAPGLLHDHPLVRIRTAEAYGHLSDPAAIELLVVAGPLAGTARATAAGAVRGHVAILDQQSYIRDFDVEVAQASFIADPKVDVVQQGVVLDATVHAVVTHRTHIVGAYRRAIIGLAGDDPGSDPAGWADWWSERRAQAGSHTARGEAAAPGAAPSAEADGDAAGHTRRARSRSTDGSAADLLPPLRAPHRPQSFVQKNTDVRSRQGSPPANAPAPGGHPPTQPPAAPQPRIPAQPRGPIR